MNYLKFKQHAEGHLPQQFSLSYFLDYTVSKRRKLQLAILIARAGGTHSYQLKPMIR
jgi:hypothetical protein